MSSLFNLATVTAAGGHTLRSGYRIQRSVRLRASASAYLNRTPASAGNRTTWTWSGWIKRGKLGAAQVLFSAGTGTAEFRFGFNSSDAIEIYEYTTPSYNWQKITTAVYRDPSAWYHIELIYDTTNGTATDRIKLYVNGTQVTSFSTNTNPASSFNGYVNSVVAHGIGSFSTGANYLDGYITEVNFIDGQALTPSSFGETNAFTGVWKPKRYAGTYGTNGFYLNFSDNSAATAEAIGKDYSGLGNNWTPNNISVADGVTYDSMLDVPTQYIDGGNGRGNYAVLNPLATKVASGTITVSNGNLSVTDTATTYGYSLATMAVSSGKWYWEVFVTAESNSTCEIGIKKNTAASINDANGVAGTAEGYSYVSSGNKRTATSSTSYGASWTANDVIGIALDMDAGTLVFYKNNSSQGTAYSSLSGEYFPAFGDFANAGQFNYAVNFGQRPFSYTPPTGFKALHTGNLPTPTILKGNQYFDATTYTGNGGTQSITNSGSFQPDFVWLKGRNSIDGNNGFDSVRGATKRLVINSTNAEDTTSGVTSFDSSGFSLGATTSNANASTYVGWQWKKGATQGFDIVTYTGNSTASRTIAHSLGVTPAMIIVKNRSAVQNWPVAHTSLAANNLLTLDTTGASTSAGTRLLLGNSSTFTVGDAADYGITNQTSQNYVAYCFSEVAGFSKFGSYTGNGSADGTFVFCGFRPAFVLIKESSGAGNNWVIYDTARDTYNEMDSVLYSNLSNAEFSGTTVNIDVLSNGFKMRDNWGGTNTNGSTYIFAAFAEHPFKNALAR